MRVTSLTKANLNNKSKSVVQEFHLHHNTLTLQSSSNYLSLFLRFKLDDYDI